jgi:hypothetical protein
MLKRSPAGQQRHTVAAREVHRTPYRLQGEVASGA